MKIFYSFAFFIVFTFAVFPSSSLPNEKDRGEKVADSMKYFPVKLLGDKPDIRLSDRVLLKFIAKDTWKFFENSVYGSTGLFPVKYL